MVIKDISFVGFLKLNVFLILIPSLLNILMSNVVRTTNIQNQFVGLQTGDTLSQKTETLPPSETAPKVISPTLELLSTMAPTLIMPFILVYVLAKIIHFLGQNTKIGSIKIGPANNYIPSK